MGKAPAFQFYIRDWLSDPELKMASHSSKGIWIDLLCYMWESSERGKITGTKEQIIKMVGATLKDMELFLSEIVTLEFGDSNFCNENVTLINRRMFLDYKGKNNTRLRVQKHRDKKTKSVTCNTNVTHTSSSSSSTAVPLIKIKGASPPFSDKEILTEAALPLIQDRIKEFVDKLYGEKIFPKVHAFVNTMKKEKRNPRAILHTLTQCYILKPKKEPWAYCLKIINVEDGNYHERDSIKTQK